MEGPPKLTGIPEGSSVFELSKKTRARIFASLMAAASVIEGPEPALAIDIEPQAEWSAGVEDIRDYVYSSKDEGAVMYGVNHSGKSSWIKPDFEFASTGHVSHYYKLGDSYRLACTFHSHNLETVTKYLNLGGLEAKQIKDGYEGNGALSVLDMPPSLQDLSSGYTSVHDESIDSETEVVATPVGFWYMEFNKDSNAFERTRQIVGELETISGLPKDIPSSLVSKIVSSNIEVKERLGRYVSEKTGEYKGDMSKNLNEALASGELSGETIESVWEQILSDERFSHMREFRESLVGWRILVEVYMQLLKDGINADDVYKDLVHQYSKLGVAVRLATYDDMKNEPPCSGVRAGAQ